MKLSNAREGTPGVQCSRRPARLNIMGSPRKAVFKHNPDLWYALWLSLGPTRTVPGLLDGVGPLGIERPPSKRTVEKWSTRYDWVRRAREFDGAVSERTQDLTVDDIATMNARQASFARTVLDLAHRKLTKVVAKEDQPQSEDVGLRDLMAIGKDAIGAERLARGAATSRAEIAIDFTNDVLPDMLRMFIQINLLADPEQREDQMVEYIDEIRKRFVGTP